MDKLFKVERMMNLQKTNQEFTIAYYKNNSLARKALHMQLEKIWLLRESKEQAQKKLQNQLQIFGYKRVPRWLSFILRITLGLSKEPISDVHIKLILFIFPVWYLGYSISNSSQQDHFEVKILYYTKGLKQLDFFGIEKKWLTELALLERSLKVH